MRYPYGIPSQNLAPPVFNFFDEFRRLDQRHNVLGNFDTSLMTLRLLCHNALDGYDFDFEEKFITLEWANVHKQTNGSDCGLFAIAFAKRRRYQRKTKKMQTIE